MRAPPLNTAALPLILLALLAAGCVQLGPEDPAEGNSDAPPSSSDVPRWRVGQRWNYTTADGGWQNWTVLGVERIDNRTAYKVQITHKAVRNTGTILGFRWYDVDNLTPFRTWTAMRGLSQSTCPGMFPLENASTSCRVDADPLVALYPAAERSVYWKRLVRNWSRVQTPAGTFDAVKVQLFAPSGVQSKWYSPEIGNAVQVKYPEEAAGAMSSRSRLFQLASWSEGSGPAAPAPGPQELEDPSTRDPADLRVPTWEVGHQWRYRGPDGAWRNWTVTGIESHDDDRVYTVKVQMVATDRGNITSRAYRIDAETLGIRETSFFGGDNLPSWAFTAPGYRLFPMTARNYTVRELNATENGTQPMPVEFSSKVSGWEDIHLGEQTVTAVHVRMETNRSWLGDREAWYHPGVRNFVRYTDDARVFELASWSLIGGEHVGASRG